jgi:hypothetical protein
MYDITRCNDMNTNGHVMIIITAAITPPVGFLSPIISFINSDQNRPTNTLIAPHESINHNEDSNNDDDINDGIIMIFILTMMMMIMIMLLIPGKPFHAS